ncbi:MAG: hypothetical protein ACJAVK_002982 [Akkermansiaceae bacterium]|jgi:hypothetical protein
MQFARSFRLLNFRFLTIFVLGGLWASSGAAEVAGVVSANQEKAFRAAARPFLGHYCIKCHGEKKQKGDLNLETMAIDMTNPEIGELWSNVFAQVQFREMPPGKSKDQPTAEDKVVFLEALDRQLKLHGRGFGLQEKLRLPEYANYLDHNSLFDGSVTEMPYTPARLWRQRPDIYSALWGNHYGRSPWLSVKIGSAGRMDARNVVKKGPQKGKTITTRYFQDSRFANPFYEFVHHASGFTDYAMIHADQASLEALLTNSEKMAEILTEGLPVTIVTEVKNKDSRHGNNHGGFVGGVETNRVERRGRVPVVFKKIVDSDEEVLQADFNAALDIAFALFLRREPDREEREHYWRDVFQKNAPLGNKMALQATLIFISLSPEFVYRMEIGMGREDAHGRRMLSPQELVYAIHHAFADTPAFGVESFETVGIYTRDAEEPIQKVMTSGDPSYRPSGWLVEQMKAGKLKTKSDVEVAVRKMLAAAGGNISPNHNRPLSSSRNPRILKFFREFFGYHHAPSVFKDTDKFVGVEGYEQFNKGSASQLRYDTDTLVLHVLRDDQDVLRELLTTERVYSSYWNGTNDAKNFKKGGGKEKYARTHMLQAYNIDPFEQEYDSSEMGGMKKALTPPRGQRFGILTQPSWLVAHSGNFDNDPVRRGKWIRDKLLAGYVMDLPINVDAQIPDDEHRSLRERFEVVEKEECWRCHKKMNPLGMPFEAFNHVGRFRETEVGKRVDTSGKISNSIDPGLHGEVEDLREMITRIANSDLARQSFIRHVFRYWMGRNEMLRDSKTLIEMDGAYLKSGGSFKELLVSLLTSDSFLYRK